MWSLEQIGTGVGELLANKYAFALVVPIAFYVMGAFGKKIIRDGHGTTFWAMSDWYLAPDAALVNLGGSLAQLVDLMGKFDAATHRGQIRGSVVFVAISFCSYLMILALHKQYEKHPSKGHQLFWLCVVANLLALSVMCLFLIAVKGVDNA